MAKKLVVICLMVFGWCFYGSAQTKRNIIKYIYENNLYHNGNAVTVTNLKLEWPLALDGNGLDGLQRELCYNLFDDETSDVSEAWVKFHERLGNRIYNMPDSVERYYIDMKLKELWYDEGNYVSLFMTRQTRNQNGEEVSSVKKFITYDILNGKVLTRSDVFTNFEYSEYGRVPFETLLEEGAVCDEGDMPEIDLTVIPRDFAVVGGALFFGLGGAVEHENYSVVSINTLYQLGNLKHNFVRWITGKQRKKRNESAVSIVPSYFDTSIPSDSITHSFDTAASYPGGNAAMSKFLNSNIKYPQIDTQLHTQGRVVLSFIVDNDGSIDDITVVNPLSASTDREAVRVVRLMPKWNPAVKDGKSVRTRITLPINYRLEVK